LVEHLLGVFSRHAEPARRPSSSQRQDDAARSDEPLGSVSNQGSVFSFDSEKFYARVDLEPEVLDGLLPERDQLLLDELTLLDAPVEW
jgi:hypothetical protein